MTMLIWMCWINIQLLPSLRPFVHVACRSRSGVCWLITVSVFLDLWYSLTWSFLPAASCPPPVLASPVLVPASACFSIPCISQLPHALGRSFSLLPGCCDPMEGDPMEGEASSAPACLACAGGMPDTRRSQCVGVKDVKQARGLWNTQLFVARGIPRSFLIRGCKVARSDYKVRFTVALDVFLMDCTSLI